MKIRSMLLLGLVYSVIGEVYEEMLVFEELFFSIYQVTS